MRIAVLHNAKAKNASENIRKEEERIKEAFDKAGGADLEFFAIESKELVAEAGRIAGENFDIIAAAGGDGTLSAVVNGIVGRGVKFGVLPMGTFNNFAKDAKIPLELDAAAENILRGESRSIDLGEVNGRYFLNNSSVGFYPHMVRARKFRQWRLGGGKMFSGLSAFIKTFRLFPTYGARISYDDANEKVATPFIFIGNNFYNVHLLSFGKRDSLHGGKLSLYYSNSSTRSKFLVHAALALIGRINFAEEFTHALTKEASIHFGDRPVSVSMDGEVTTMRSPLLYRCRPGALETIMPKEEEK
ncbi:MAG: diacylglycerol/lipid kinase family protein [Chloroflexota bacterium]